MSDTLPPQARRLGKSRVYTLADLPPRLREWHAPRINRWERLLVTAGQLTLAIARPPQPQRQLALTAGAVHVMAPGTRWRVCAMDAATRFELEVHAAPKGQAAAPEPLRSAWLERAHRQSLDTCAQLVHFVSDIAYDKWFVADAAFPVTALSRISLPQAHLTWHPLAVTADGFTALLAVRASALDLMSYLQRDHAVIEAALGGALAGHAEHLAWLRYTLERHLVLEESWLFPAYLQAGGRPEWVKGLCHEHQYLRQYLQAFEHADHQRKLLRLLDGHDEKEERVVYPDIMQHLQTESGAILAQAQNLFTWA